MDPNNLLNQNPPAVGAGVVPQQPMPATAASSLDPRSQIIERLKGSVNVLVTVSNDPSVDQLSAAIGFTLILNKLKKHGTAVFSGLIPPAIEFLQPEKTIEKNTDSLRDFIVSLDKAKADKLRYKIEDKFVKIFITPYHTSLTEKDLEFGQGDLNVDVILALGVNHRDQLDQAVTAHGRILHDATIISITHQQADDIGTINWHVPNASSFSEILVDLSESLKSPGAELFDQQIATAFLTGIVAETDRFSNDKTTPQTMSVSAILMKAGANQQLIANKLEEPEPMPMMIESRPMPTLPSVPASAPPATTVPKPDDGSLDIPHEESAKAAEEVVTEEAPDIHIDDEGRFLPNTDEATPSVATPITGLPPITANSADLQANQADQTLEDIEKSVNSPHITKPGEAPDPLSASVAPVMSTPMPSIPPAVTPVVDDDVELPHLTEAEARQKVEEAEEKGPAAATDEFVKPIAALNSVPVDLNLSHDSNPQTSAGATPAENSLPGTPPPPPMAPPWTPPTP